MCVALAGGSVAIGQQDWVKTQVQAIEQRRRAAGHQEGQLGFCGHRIHRLTIGQC